MDDPSLARDSHARALRGLERINRVSRCAAQMLPAVVLASRGRESVRVLDVATGSGDVAVDVALRARRLGIRVSLGLCDISRTALDIAMERSLRAGLPAERFGLDVTTEELPSGFDLATCSLFLHHLDRARCITVLKSMGKAARIVAVNDLRRTRRGIALAWAGSRVLSMSRIVHFDAVASARAAWTIDELRSMATEAGLSGAHAVPAWPLRMALTWEKS